MNDLLLTGCRDGVGARLEAPCTRGIPLGRWSAPVPYSVAFVYIQNNLTLAANSGTLASDINFTKGNWAMEKRETALTHQEALELITYLLASAQVCITRDPPDYVVLRLATAADRIARHWAPRASGELATYLEELSDRMPSEVARTDVDLEGFSQYLSEQVSRLAGIVKRAGVDGEESEQ